MSTGSTIDRFDGEFRFLSNFYPSPIHYQRLNFDTVEHAFQAHKTRDPEERRLVQQAASPGRAKRLGRKVTLRKDWESIKVALMRELLVLKFTTHEDLRGRLLETATATLVEGNTWNDRFWGVCGGEGKNHLGRLLMEVREELRLQTAQMVEAP